MMDMHGFETGVRLNSLFVISRSSELKNFGSFRRPKLDRWLIY